MNLYKITFSHSAPKDTKNGIETYLLAENEEQVYGYIDREFNCECWKDQENENEIFKIFDKRFNEIGTETFKQKIIRIKGEMNDEDYDYCDAYYGITLYGWELVERGTTTDFTKMIELGIISKLSQ